MATIETPLNSPELYLSGDGGQELLRDSAALTTSYVTTDIVNISYAKSILLLINLIGTGITDSQLKIQFGDGTTMYDLVHSYIDTATITGNLTLQPTVFEMGGTTITLALPLINPGCSHMSCSVKANAAAGNLRLNVLRGQSSGAFPMLVAGT